MSTTSRILLGFLVFLAAGLYAFDDRLSKRVERQYLEAAEESMVDVAQLLAARIEAEGFDVATLRREWEAAKRRKFSAQIYTLTKTTLAMNVYVTDERGTVLFDSDGGRTEGRNIRGQREIALTLSGQYGARSTRLDPKDSDSSVMFVSAPIWRDGRISGVVTISKAQRSLFGFRDETRLWIRSIGLICFGAVAVGAYLVVTLFSRPIRRLTEYAHAIARGERTTLPRGGSGEAATLGRAFEEMRDALENRDYVENYVQTLTHEMKSPVAAIHGAAELLHEDMPRERRERFVANIQAEARRLQNIIDRLLALSTLESRKNLDHPGAVAICNLVQEILAQLETAAAARNVRFDLRCEGSPEVLGESFLLESALHNLLQNAIDFSPEGGVIRIRVAPEAAGKTPPSPSRMRDRVFPAMRSLAFSNASIRSSARAQAARVPASDYVSSVRQPRSMAAPSRSRIVRKAAPAPCSVSRSARTAATDVEAVRADGAPHISQGLVRRSQALEVSLRAKMSDNLLLTC